MLLKIKSGETVLFVGDSITDCGRRATAKPLGEGYVKLFSDLVTIREPAKNVTIINKGIGGNRVTDLANRWTDDVLRHKPHWLSILIGINDAYSVWRNAPDAVDPLLFRKTYDEILSRTRKALPRCKILLMEPFFISTDETKGTFRSEMLALLQDYIGVVHEMSHKFRTELVCMHETFQRLLRHHEPDVFCPEPVHPNSTGHLVIAEAVYEAWSK